MQCVFFLAVFAHIILRQHVYVRNLLLFNVSAPSLLTITNSLMYGAGICVCLILTENRLSLFYLPVCVCSSCTVVEEKRHKSDLPSLVLSFVRSFASSSSSSDVDVNIRSPSSSFASMFFFFCPPSSSYSLVDVVLFLFLFSSPMLSNSLLLLWFFVCVRTTLCH